MSETIDDAERKMFNHFRNGMNSLEFWEEEVASKDLAYNRVSALSRAHERAETFRNIGTWYLAANNTAIIGRAIQEAAEDGVTVSPAEEIEIATSYIPGDKPVESVQEATSA